MKSIPKMLFLVVAFVIVARFWDLSGPWKRKDHYNFGGVATTRMIECLKKTPLLISKGIPHYECEPGKPPGGLYPNHPPGPLLGAALFTSVLGTSEAWGYRLFFLLFSILNIFLVGRIALFFIGDLRFAWLAAAVHGSTLFSLYLGSHIEFTSEVSTTFLLLAIWAGLRGWVHRSGALALLSGFMAWGNFFVFGALTAGSWIRTRKFPGAWLVWTIFAILVSLALMMWLHQKTELVHFLKDRLVHPPYAPSDKNSVFYFFDWIRTWLANHSRYLSPLYLAILLFQIPWLVGQLKMRETAWKWIVLSGAGVLYVFVGRDYVYIHAFQYCFLVPFYTILISHYFYQLANEGLMKNETRLRWLLVLGLAFYPFGVYKSSPSLDVFNSLAYIGISLSFGLWVAKSARTLKPAARFQGILVVIFLVALVNTLQMINYRGEAPRDYEFCLKAREEFAQTGRAVESLLTKHPTRDFYCDPIPLIEPKGSEMPESRN